MVITGGPARHVHGAIVLRILAILRDWLLAPPPGGSLTLKEAVLFLQRLAHMLAMGVLRGQTAAAFERVFLQLLLTLCTPSAHPQARARPPRRCGPLMVGRTRPDAGRRRPRSGRRCARRCLSAWSASTCWA